MPKRIVPGKLYQLGYEPELSWRLIFARGQDAKLLHCLDLIGDEMLVGTILYATNDHANFGGYPKFLYGSSEVALHYRCIDDFCLAWNIVE